MLIQWHEQRGPLAPVSKTGCSVVTIRKFNFHEGLETTIFEPEVVSSPEIIECSIAEVQTDLWQQFVELDSIEVSRSMNRRLVRPSAHPDNTPEDRTYWRKLYDEAKDA